MRDTLTSIMGWFRKAVPAPTTKNFSTQMGVHFEEVREMMAEITPLNQETHEILLEAVVAVQKLADHLKSHVDVVEIISENRVKYLDALCDQIVTATGCAYMSEMNLPGAADRVDEKNWDKFVDGEPIFNENMKIMKRPGWEPADLSEFV